MASEHRGHTSQESSSQVSSVSQTYASAAFLPKRDQAIVIDSIEGCTIDDYLDGIELLVGINNIKFISKISGGRVCVYLVNKAMVEELSNKKVQVKSHILSIRPLLEKNRRVVISNASPSIPNEVIILALQKKGIQIVSQMHYIRASTSKPERSHIYSFRRQVYIKEEDEHLLPENLLVNCDNTPHWIYLSTESTHCFVCKQKGHIAKVCQEAQSKVGYQHTLVSQENNDIENSDQSNSYPKLLTTETIKLNLKRPPASTTSEGSSLTQTSNISEGSHNQVSNSAPTPPKPKPKDPIFLKPSKKKLKLNKKKISPMNKMNMKIALKNIWYQQKTLLKKTQTNTC